MELAYHYPVTCGKLSESRKAELLSLSERFSSPIYHCYKEILLREINSASTFCAYLTNDLGAAVAFILIIPQNYQNNAEVTSVFCDPKVSQKLLVNLILDTCTYFHQIKKWKLFMFCHNSQTEIHKCAKDIAGIGETFSMRHFPNRDFLSHFDKYNPESEPFTKGWSCLWFPNIPLLGKTLGFIGLHDNKRKSHATIKALHSLFYNEKLVESVEINTCTSSVSDLRNLIQNFATSGIRKIVLYYSGVVCGEDPQIELRKGEFDSQSPNNEDNKITLRSIKEYIECFECFDLIIVGSDCDQISPRNSNLNNHYDSPSVKKNFIFSPLVWAYEGNLFFYSLSKREEILDTSFGGHFTTKLCSLLAESPDWVSTLEKSKQLADEDVILFFNFAFWMFTKGT